MTLEILWTAIFTHRVSIRAVNKQVQSIRYNLARALGDVPDEDVGLRRHFVRQRQGKRLLFTINANHTMCQDVVLC